MPRAAAAWIAAYSLRPARAGRPRGVFGAGPVEAWRCTRVGDRAGEPAAGVASCAFMTGLRTRDVGGLPSVQIANAGCASCNMISIAARPGASRRSATRGDGFGGERAVNPVRSAGGGLPAIAGREVRDPARLGHRDRIGRGRQPGRVVPERVPAVLPGVAPGGAVVAPDAAREQLAIDV